MELNVADGFTKQNNFCRFSDVPSTAIIESSYGEVFVTIAIPTYKRGRQLKDTIDSALMQSGEYPFDVIIVDNKIHAARCTLPITEQARIPAQYGMRHRAAVGLTEQTDAIVVVVSEETGNISVVENGAINRMKGGANEMRTKVESLLKAPV